MFVLGIETATERVGIAIGNGDGVRAQYEVTMGRRHAETVAPAIEAMCRDADVALSEMSTIAVDIGPGLFTGLRVGLATGKSLAQALHIPMVRVTSLEILAHPLRLGDRVVVSIVDGRKGQVFYGFFRPTGGDIQQVTEPTAGTIEDVAIAIADRAQDVVCVGDGALRYRDDLDHLRFVEVADRFLAHPSVGSLVQRAMIKIRSGEEVEHGEVDALYLRRPDAEINWESRVETPS